ncbi:VOC family protein [Myxococcota bacterium]|nr:VOC family protein [Myxococcota bacterium]
MGLHRLLGIEIGVPDPVRLDGFYREIGLAGSDGKWGSESCPNQFVIAEAPYRQLREIRVACESEEDLASTVQRLEGIGIGSETRDGKLHVPDPVNKWNIVIEPCNVADIPAVPPRESNRPGERNRLGKRPGVMVEPSLRPPRRLGHVVFGTNDILATHKLYIEGIGFKISDIAGGLAFFTRCSPDHHNLLMTPAPVPYLNHYAMELDDIDAVCASATQYLNAHEGTHIAGPGRHQIGGNMFWYLRDPSGTFFEYFADMDRIVDDEAWEVREDWGIEDSWSLWGEQNQPQVFFAPDDIEEVIAGWNQYHSG